MALDQRAQALKRKRFDPITRLAEIVSPERLDEAETPYRRFGIFDATMTQPKIMQDNPAVACSRQ